MQDACLLLGADCRGLEVPTLIFDELGRPLGLYYTGGRVVFLTSDCLSRVADTVKCEAILVHELSHYIAWYVMGLRDMCASEALAWDVFNAYVMERKRLDLVVENWSERYPQCAKSPNSSTSSDTP